MDPRTEQERFERERAELWGAMVRTKGWKLYMDLVATHIDQGGMALLDELPLNGVNAALRQEYAKGVLRGFIMARDIVQLAVANAPPRSGEDMENSDE